MTGVQIVTVTQRRCDDLKICLVGPCSPHDLVELLTDFTPSSFEKVGFYRGIPVSTLAIELIRSNHEVEIVSTAMGLKEAEIVFHGEKLKLTIVKGSSSARNRALTLFWRDRKNIERALKKVDADIFHAHWTYEFALATLKIKKKVLVTAHDSPIKILFHYRDAYRFLRFILACVVRVKCKNLAAVSPYLATNWHRWMIWKKEIDVLPNLIPSGFSKEVLIENQRDNYILCVSDSSELKNVKLLIRAWSSVHREANNYKLTLVGHGLGVNQEIHKWAAEAGLDWEINWRGYLERSEIIGLMQSATLLCHPSLEESHCLVLLEALSLGVPVIAGDRSGAVPWSVGSAALLVNVKSEKDISRAIIELIREPELRNKLSQLGVSHVNTNFSSERLLQNYLTVYAKIIKRI